MTVAPDFSLKTAGPKSGFHSGCFIFSKNPSYSPARITARFARELSVAALSYRYTGIFNSSPTRFPKRFAQSIASSQLTLLTGMNGQTSVAPMRGCAPLCLRISMSSAAFSIARNAAFTAASGFPTNVTTVRFVLAPGSTSSSETPSTDLIASVICRITSTSRPSEKFGTHSISFFIGVWSPDMDACCDDGQRGSERHHRQSEKENDKGILEDSLAEYRVLG